MAAFFQNLLLITFFVSSVPVLISIFEVIRIFGSLIVGSAPVAFLVACYATLHPALSVRPSVRRSVRPSHFTFSAFMGFLAIPLLPKCSTVLIYGLCPPVRDWGSWVSGHVSYFLMILDEFP